MTEEDEAEPVFLPMVCTCSPEGRAGADARMRSVLHRVGAGSQHLLPRAVTAERFLSEVAMSLSVDLGAHLTQVLMDQWFVVTAEQILGEDRERRIVVQADAVEDGIAAIWEFLADEADPHPDCSDAYPAGGGLLAQQGCGQGEMGTP